MKKYSARETIGKSVDFFLKYWTVVSVTSGLVFAIFVYFYFDIGFFEAQNEKYETKKIVKFYRNLGREYLNKYDHESAKEAFLAALKIAPNDFDSHLGLATAKIFDPRPGEKYMDIETITERLSLLEKQFPEEFSNNAVFLITKSFVEDQRGNGLQSVLLAKKAIKIDSSNATLYVHLGYIYQKNRYSLDDAGKMYEKATKLNPNNSNATMNLGYYYLYDFKLDSAYKYLAKSVSLSPNYTNHIGLGYAYRSAGLNKENLEIHSNLLAKLENDVNKNEVSIRFYSGEIMFNYFPLKEGDKFTSKDFILVHDIAAKKDLLYFEICIDYALLGDFNNAEKYYKLGANNIQNQYLIKYMKNHVKFLEKVSYVKTNKNIEWLRMKFK